MLSDEDWKIIENLVEFLKIFRSATEVLSGATYPTISLILLFGVEIAAALTESPNDCQVVKLMKQRMRQSLNYRLPIQWRHLGGMEGSADPPRIVKCKSFALSVSSKGSLYISHNFFLLRCSVSFLFLTISRLKTADILDMDILI